MHGTRIALALLTLVGIACGGSRSAPEVVRAGDLEIAVRSEPPDFRVGRNSLWIELRDAEGRPVGEADVDVRVHMHAMGAMPAMGGPAAVAEVGEGRYRADFELEMGSTWLVEIAARPPGGAEARAEGSLTVGTPGVRLAGAEGPAPADGAEGPERGDPAASEAQGRRPGEFRIEPGRIQKVGVRTGAAELRAVETRIRAAGRVVAEETTLADVSLKVRGWVEEVRVDALGDPVERGEVLFTLYSPELYAAQQEYVQALRSRERARATDAPDRADPMVRAARSRLRLWDVGEAELERLARGGEPREQVPIRAPVSGYVVEKNVVDGSAVMPGQRLYRIAPLSRVWVEAEIYEAEVSAVREGQRAVVTLPYHPGRRFEADVAYVQPTVDPRTRTVRVRLELPNPDLALRPGMYADAVIRADRGERLVVPVSAVLHAGERSFVFRALGEGRFRPQEIQVGLRTGEEVEVLEGLEPGDPVVTSATFLIASESRLRAALEQW